MLELVSEDWVGVMQKDSSGPDQEEEWEHLEGPVKDRRN